MGAIGGGASLTSETIATARARCARLGLDGGTTNTRKRPPMPTQPRLPVCTLDPQRVGLWERFQQRCGTALPPESPAMPCELKKSRAGGSVLVPLVVAAGNTGN